MKVSIPGLRLESEANKRDRWAAIKRAKAQHKAVAHALIYRPVALWVPLYLPLIVTIVRVGVRKLDDDNLARSAKAVRDAIAKHYGVDDGDGSITWRYWQRKGKPREYACELLIEPRTAWAVGAHIEDMPADRLRAYVVECERILATKMETE
jgi:hypothetical protein